MFSYLHQPKGFYKHLFLLALPVIVQNLITTSLGFLDTFMVGLLGSDQMSAVTVANVPVFIIQLVVFGLQSGSSVLISQFYGKGDYDAISRVMGIGFYVSGAVNLVFGCIMCFFPVQFMGLFGSDAGVIALAAEYARMVAFSFFFDGLAQVYIAAHRSMANPKLGLYILVVSMVSNTFLNWVFIFGNLGAPALGVVGAAVATLSARVLEFVIMLSYALTNRRFRLKPAVLFRPGRALLAKFLHYSGPVVLNETLWGLGTAIYPTIMGHMEGSQAILAAFGISGNIEKVATVVVFAIAGTAAIIVGREIGAGRRDTVYEVGLTLDTLAFLAGLIVGLVLIVLTFTFFSPVLYPMFHLSPEASSIATMMSVVTFSFLSLRSFNSTNTVGVLRGGGDVRTASIIDLSPLWFVSIPLAALAGLVFHWGILVVYLCISLENVVKFFFGMARLRSGAWIRDVTAA